MPPPVCSDCHHVFDVQEWANRDFKPCPYCRTESRLLVFPAYGSDSPTIESGELVKLSEDGSCFYHDDKKAEVTCHQCGRFLCALCDIEISENKHICSSCVHSGISKKKDDSLEKERILYGDIAVSVAILPMIIFYFTLITGPLAIFIAIKYWKKPGPMFSKWRWRESLAIFIGAAQIIGWCFMGAFLYKTFASRHSVFDPQNQSYESHVEVTEPEFKDE